MKIVHEGTRYYVYEGTELVGRYRTQEEAEKAAGILLKKEMNDGVQEESYEEEKEEERGEEAGSDE